MLRVARLIIVAATASLLAPAWVVASEVSAAGEPLRVGAPVTVKKPVNIEKLAKNPEKFAGRTVRLEGVVKDVCQGRGCWVEVATPKGASFMARSLDESVLLPKDCHGRKIVVQGLVTTLSKSAAEEAKPEDHACPRPSYIVATQGVELAAAK
jgi:hypothetical protein